MDFVFHERLYVNVNDIIIIIITPNLALWHSDLTLPSGYVSARVIKALTFHGADVFQRETPISTDGSLDLTLWQEFCDRSAKCIVNIVQFAKRVPGFDECSTPDQVTMLKAACLDILVRVASRKERRILITIPLRYATLLP